MKNTIKKTALSLAMGAGLIGGSAAHACPTDPILSAVCIMAFGGTWGDFGTGMYLQADGRMLSISQNSALFSLLGTTYGGNGTTTFALPDLRGRVVVGAGGTYTIGQTGGTTTVTLTAAQMPAHNHMLVGASVDLSKMTATTTLTGLSATLSGSLKLKAATGGTTSNDPTGKALTSSPGTMKLYSDAAPSIAMNTGAIDSSGLTVGNFSGNPATTLGGTATASGTTSVVGGSQPVSTMMPYLVLKYYVAVQGTYPSRD